MSTATEPTVVVSLTWSQARALAYASQWGLEHGKWPSAEYRNTAYEARVALLEAEARTNAKRSRTRSGRADTEKA